MPKCGDNQRKGGSFLLLPDRCRKTKVKCVILARGCCGSSEIGSGSSNIERETGSFRWEV